MFATLQNSAEGLIPLAALPFGAVADEEAGMLRFGRECYRLADRIRVVITDAEVATHRIQLSLLSHTQDEM